MLATLRLEWANYVEGGVLLTQATAELDDLKRELAEAHSQLATLRESQRRWLTVEEHAPDYIVRLDRDGIISYMNRPPPGHTLADMIGSNLRRWVQPEYHAAFEQALGQVFEQGQPASCESVGAITGRRYIHRMNPVVLEGLVSDAILITHDITELKEATQRAREVDERCRALLEASFEGLALSIDNRIVEANQAFAAMLGRDVAEVIGLSAADLATPESAALVAQRVREGSEAPYEIIALRKDGSQFPCEVLGRSIQYRGRPARITGFRDLAERRRHEAERGQREERVRHAQKLETLGVLAGGIAHDFNNLLATILGYVEVGRLRSGDGAQIRECLEQIGVATRRASELTNQLLVYSGRGQRRSEILDINSIVSESIVVLRGAISKKADLRYVPGEALPPIEADASQLRQTLLNLAVNASEALGAEPGCIHLRTGRQQLDADYLRACVVDEHVLPGLYAYVEVTDTGSGMDAATQRRIFDPFFTTKFSGRGLGLASVLGIARAHRAAIRVTSVLGSGTQVRVFFPVVAVGERVLTAAKECNDELAATEVLRGLVLVADDHPMLALTTAELLKSVGYDVLVAHDGESALEQFERHAGGLKFAVLDVSMPRKGGLEVRAEIRKRAPRLPIVLMSGCADSEATRGDELTEFIAKPFELRALLAALARLADAAITLADKR